MKRPPRGRSVKRRGPKKAIHYTRPQPKRFTPATQRAVKKQTLRPKPTGISHTKVLGAKYSVGNFGGTIKPKYRVRMVETPKGFEFGNRIYRSDKKLYPGLKLQRKHFMVAHDGVFSELNDIFSHSIKRMQGTQIQKGARRIIPFEPHVIRGKPFIINNKDIEHRLAA